PPAAARHLLRLHRATYPVYWEWSDSVVNYALVAGKLHTRFGWMVHTTPGSNARSLANYPMQANGAEMLRTACVLATERGISVCAPVHDALLVEGPADAIDEVGRATQESMARASEIVLDGFRVGTDAKVVRYPDRYMDPRGEK